MDRRHTGTKLQITVEGVEKERSLLCSLTLLGFRCRASIDLGKGELTLATDTALARVVVPFFSVICLRPPCVGGDRFNRRAITSLCGKKLCSPHPLSREFILCTRD